MWRGNTQNPAPNPIDQKGNVSDVKISENRALKFLSTSKSRRTFNALFSDILISETLLDMGSIGTYRTYRIHAYKQ